MNKKSLSGTSVFVFSLLLLLGSLGGVGSASFEEDPIKKTQSAVVPVTSELLSREGEPGPASPTFKMSDTSGFFVKKPYQRAEKLRDHAAKTASGRDAFEGSFSWQTDAEIGSWPEFDSELIDIK